jgi:hypothetical protein
MRNTCLVLVCGLVTTAAWAGEPASSPGSRSKAVSPTAALTYDYGTVITFDEFPNGTVITNQYAEKGVVFGGDSPFIAGDSTNPTSPVLSGSPLFLGEIEGRFVNKVTGEPVTIDGFALDAGYFDGARSVSISLYDRQGNLITRRVNKITGIETFEFPIAVHKFRIKRVGDGPDGFGIDNVSLDRRRNLLKNGDFEEPLSPSGGWQLYSVGQAFSGWRVIGVTGSAIALTRSNFTWGGIAFPAQKANQWLDLTGIAGKAGGVVQRVDTVPGQCYELSFYVGNVYNPEGPWGVSSTVNVSFDGKPYPSARNRIDDSTTSLVWKKFKRVVRATSTRAAVMFINADPPNDDLNGVDNVRLIPTSCS